MACTICGGPTGTIYKVDGFEVDHPIKVVTLAYLCSPSCLVEFAWQERQKERKLSKSNDFPKPLCPAGKHLVDEGYPCPECAKEIE